MSEVLPLYKATDKVGGSLLGLTGLVGLVFSLSGCGALLEVTMVGAGKSATVEQEFKSNCVILPK